MNGRVLQFQGFGGQLDIPTPPTGTFTFRSQLPTQRFHCRSTTGSKGVGMAQWGGGCVGLGYGCDTIPTHWHNSPPSPDFTCASTGSPPEFATKTPKIMHLPILIRNQRFLKTPEAKIPEYYIGRGQTVVTSGSGSGLRRGLASGWRRGCFF